MNFLIKMTCHTLVEKSFYQNNNSRKYSHVTYTFTLIKERAIEISLNAVLFGIGSDNGLSSVRRQAIGQVRLA